jgi:hypothetical protein
MATPSSSSSSYSGGSGNSSSSYSGGSSSSSSHSGRDYGKRGDRDRDWDNRSSQSRKPAAKRSFSSDQQAPNKRGRDFIPACPAKLSCTARGRCGFHHSNHDLLAFLELPPLPFGMPSLETHPAPEVVAVAAEAAARAAAEAAARAAAVASSAKVASTGGEVPKIHSDVATALAQHKEADEEPGYSPLTNSDSDEDEDASDENYPGDETGRQKKR